MQLCIKQPFTQSIALKQHSQALSPSHRDILSHLV